MIYVFKELGILELHVGTIGVYIVKYQQYWGMVLNIPLISILHGYLQGIPPVIIGSAPPPPRRAHRRFVSEKFRFNSYCDLEVHIQS